MKLTALILSIVFIFSCKEVAPVEQELRVQDTTKVDTTLVDTTFIND